MVFEGLLFVHMYMFKSHLHAKLAMTGFIMPVRSLLITCHGCLRKCFTICIVSRLVAIEWRWLNSGYCRGWNPCSCSIMRQKESRGAWNLGLLLYMWLYMLFFQVYHIALWHHVSTLKLVVSLLSFPTSCRSGHDFPAKEHGGCRPLGCERVMGNFCSRSPDAFPGIFSAWEKASYHRQKQQNIRKLSRYSSYRIQMDVSPWGMGLLNSFFRGLGFLALLVRDIDVKRWSQAEDGCFGNTSTLSYMCWLCARHHCHLDLLMQMRTCWYMLIYIWYMIHVVFSCRIL